MLGWDNRADFAAEGCVLDVAGGASNGESEHAATAAGGAVAGAAA